MSALHALLHHIHIIVAHNQIFYRGVLTILKGKCNEKPQFADSVAALFNVLVLQKTNVVIMDDKLTGKSNDSIAELKNQHPDLKIIIVTEKNDTDYLQKMADEGVTGFVHPYTKPKDFKKAIQEVAEDKMFYCPLVKNKVAENDEEAVLILSAKCGSQCLKLDSRSLKCGSQCLKCSSQCLKLDSQSLKRGSQCLKLDSQSLK
jgi:DNA-binding NarL/FixJ family response regulator